MIRVQSGQALWSVGGVRKKTLYPLFPELQGDVCVCVCACVCARMTGVSAAASDAGGGLCQNFTCS